MYKFYLTVLIFTVACSRSISVSKQTLIITNKSIQDSIFVQSLRVLDSTADLYPNDSIIYCCKEEVLFMEKRTGIESGSPGTFAGKLYFLRVDLERWRSWYKAGGILKKNLVRRF